MAGHHDSSPRPRAQAHVGDDPSSLNIEAVARLERESRRRRTRFDRVIDTVRSWAGSPAFIIIHLLWIPSWITFNLTGRAFDPFPFSFLNLTLAIEAIVLSGFVLMAQDRMTKDADRRDHLNLQVDLLAEQELTAILKVVTALAERGGIDVKKDIPEIERLHAHTDIQQLVVTLEHHMGEASDAASSVEDDATK